MSPLSSSLASVPLVKSSGVLDPAFDGVVLVTHSSDALLEHDATAVLAPAVSRYLQLNVGAKSAGIASLLPVNEVAGGRLIIAFTGPLHRDFDDVRRFGDAGRAAFTMAIKAGMKSPMLVTLPDKTHREAAIVATLGALHTIYIPLNLRDDGETPRLDKLGLLAVDHSIQRQLTLLAGLDAAGVVCRDVGDSDPQRMAPPKVAEYVQAAFAGGNVKVRVEDDQNVILKDFPLMAAVNRAANQVPEHQARLIWLEYVPDGPIEETLMLVGKGVTIDTGGTDLKVGGSMFGMCRDKYGSAVVAGFFKALDVLRPKGIKVVGYMCMVRNSIGEYSYTTDEIIRSRSGKRVHVYNTDAEGRLTMLDPLTHMRQLAEKEVNPHLFTLATLTGHAYLSYGPYATVLENGPAQDAGTAALIQRAGDAFGQPVETSRIRREDYNFHDAEELTADIRQGGTKPSVQTLRGHQAPAAFMIRGSRLDEHGRTSPHPIKFAHVDMGNCMGDMPKITYPNPLFAFIAAYIVPRLGK